MKKGERFTVTYEVTQVTGEGICYAPVQDDVADRSVTRFVSWIGLCKMKTGFSHFYRHLNGELFAFEGVYGDQVALRRSGERSTKTVGQGDFCQHYEPFSPEILRKMSTGELYRVIQCNAQETRLECLSGGFCKETDHLSRRYEPIDILDVLKPYTYWKCKSNNKVYCITDLGKMVRFTDRATLIHREFPVHEVFDRFRVANEVPIEPGYTFNVDGALIVVLRAGTMVRYVVGLEIREEFRASFQSRVLERPWK